MKAVVPEFAEESAFRRREWGGCQFKLTRSSKEILNSQSSRQDTTSSTIVNDFRGEYRSRDKRLNF